MTQHWNDIGISMEYIQYDVPILENHDHCWNNLL